MHLAFEVVEQPEHQPHGGPADSRDVSERERELAIIAQAQADLAGVDRALERLDDGTYGTCEVCGEAIADDVLERAPASRLCPSHGAAVR